MASEVLEATGAMFPFTLEAILLELEGGCYVGPILPGVIVYILAFRRTDSNIGAGGGGRGSR